MTTCPSPNVCSTHNTCKTCLTMGQCLWCPSLSQCMPAILYPVSFPFGQCLGWAKTCDGECLFVSL